MRKNWFLCHFVIIVHTTSPFMYVRMAERSKAPDSRDTLFLWDKGAFWSTYVGVGSNPTSDKHFWALYIKFTTPHPVQKKLYLIKFDSSNADNDMNKISPPSRIWTSDLRMPVTAKYHLQSSALPTELSVVTGEGEIKAVSIFIVSQHRVLIKTRVVCSRGWFRSTDLWVMGPARFLCATLLVLNRRIWRLYSIEKWRMQFRGGLRLDARSRFVSCHIKRIYWNQV